MAKNPKYTAPEGTCDTHMHFYKATFPTAKTARMTPPDAWVDDYRMVRKRLNLSRVVAVQPTTYGTDNACQEAAMKAFGNDARGVAAIDVGTPDSEIERLHALGFRGARFHMMPGGAVPWESLAPVAAQVANFGWHIQLQFNGRELPEHKDRIARLPGTFVFDHLGRFTPPVKPDAPEFKILLDFLETGKCWVKLSAPYESSKAAPAYADTIPEARALVAARPDRMLWASNWPHPGQNPAPDEADMLDILLEWTDDEATRKRILVDNPARLYGF